MPPPPLPGSGATGGPPYSAVASVPGYPTPGPGWSPASRGSWGSSGSSGSSVWAGPRPLVRLLGGVGLAAVLAIGLAVIALRIFVLSDSPSPSRPAAADAQPAATADVTTAGCAVDPISGLPKATGQVLNHSPVTGNYLITLSFVDPSGSVVAQGFAARSGVAPGQSIAFDAVGTRP